MKKITWFWFAVAAFVTISAQSAMAEAGFLSLIGEVGSGIATGGLSTILGGITGVFGSWLNNRHALKVKNLDQTFQLGMLRENRKTSIIEAKLNMEQTVVMTAGAIDTELAKGRETSQRMANVGDEALTLISGLKDGFFKGYCIFIVVHVFMVVKMIRPGIVIYLITASTLFVGKVFLLMEKQGDLDQILSDSGGPLIMYTANALFYFLGVAIGYYYQERNRIKAPEGYAFQPTQGGGTIMVKPTSPIPSSVSVADAGVPPGDTPSPEDDELHLG